MKKIKQLLILLVLLTMSLSVFSACRPATDEDEDDWNVGTEQQTNSGQDENEQDGGQDENEQDGEQNENEQNGSEQNENEQNGSEQNGGEQNGGENDGEQNVPQGTGPAATDFYSNPLMSPSKPYNTEIKVSYDIDEIGFTKGKLSDLKGKILTFYNCSGYELFSYYNKSNKNISERTWLKELRKTYGVTVKVVQGDRPGVKAFQAMSAGKDIDLISTHVSSFPYICNIMAPLEQYVNMNKVQENPGINPMMTTITKWKGNSIVLAPNGSVGALKYNATFVKSAGLDDPYELWKAGQ